MEDEGMKEPSSQIRKVKRNRNYNWTDAEVRTLMKSWFDHHKEFHDSKFGCSRRLLYDKISFDIRRFGFQRSRTEAQNKLQNLLKTYRKEKQDLKKSGEKYSRWRYFYLVKHIVEPDPDEINNPLQDYISSDEDSKDVETDNGSSAHIIKLSNSVASDSDNAGSSHPLTDSQDITENEDDSFHPSRKQRNNIEGILSGFLTEFKRSNLQLEKNDKEMMGLLKENNELCRKQIELLTLFLNK